MDTNGWADTGQHFTVSRGGYVLEGRHRSLETLDAGEHQVIAAHCPGENGNAIGIENEGTYVTETPPEALLDSLVELCVAVCRQFRPERRGTSSATGTSVWAPTAPASPSTALFPRSAPRVLQAAGRLARALPGPPLAGHLAVRRQPGGEGRASTCWWTPGYSDLSIDGVFSTDMNAVVADFQTSQGLAVTSDATFDTATWEALAPVLGKHASGLPVEAVQYMLTIKGYADTVDDHRHLRPRHQKAVKDMQRLHGLHPNGKVDLSTWCALVGGIVRETFM